MVMASSWSRNAGDTPFSPALGLQELETMLARFWATAVLSAGSAEHPSAEYQMIFAAGATACTASTSIACSLTHSSRSHVGLGSPPPGGRTASYCPATNAGAPA